MLLFTVNFLFPELFYLAHRLVDLHPEMAISWFAVGCYYYIIGQVQSFKGSAVPNHSIFVQLFVQCEP